MKERAMRIEYKKVNNTDGYAQRIYYKKVTEEKRKGKTNIKRERKVQSKV